MKNMVTWLVQSIVAAVLTVALVGCGSDEDLSSVGGQTTAVAKNVDKAVRKDSYAVAPSVPLNVELTKYMQATYLSSGAIKSQYMALRCEDVLKFINTDAVYLTPTTSYVSFTEYFRGEAPKSLQREAEEYSKTFRSPPVFYSKGGYYIQQWLKESTDGSKLPFYYWVRVATLEADAWTERVLNTKLDCRSSDPSAAAIEVRIITLDAEVAKQFDKVFTPRNLWPVKDEDSEYPEYNYRYAVFAPASTELDAFKGILGMFAALNNWKSSPLDPDVHKKSTSRVLSAFKMYNPSSKLNASEALAAMPQE